MKSSIANRSNVVRAMLEHWCTCVMRSKVDPMKDVARMIRSHLEGIVAWGAAYADQRFLEAESTIVPGRRKRRARASRASRRLER